jgi:hypothetical protein
MNILQEFCEWIAEAAVYVSNGNAILHTSAIIYIQSSMIEHPSKRFPYH